ncbi:MAG: PIN domain-containing protein [Candidatus Anammoxibacter sp.]
MGLVLDSTILISAERKKLDLSRLLLDQSVTETVLISVVTASELLHGCERAKNEKTRKKRIEFVEGILNYLPIVDFGLSEARGSGVRSLILLSRQEQLSSALLQT